MTSVQPGTRPAVRYTIWTIGVLAYMVAVLQRTSLGVAGIEATHRFDASASVLSMFMVIQLVVYAGLQIPVGIMLDRLGPRTLIVAGAVLMAGGQCVLGFADNVGVGIVGRLLVGAGDAFTFISVLRLVSVWFPASQAPIFTQLTGITGQIGQILSAYPFVWLLHGAGWSPAFFSAAGLSTVCAIVAFLVVRTPSRPRGDEPAPSLREIGRTVVATAKQPGTRLGFWTHFTTPFSGNVFVFLWGVPFLVSAQGLATSTASALLTLYAIGGMIAGPVLGKLVASHPLRRSWLVLTVVAATVAAWAVVLAWPGQAPPGLLVVLVLVLACAGPGSMIAFDFARTFNPPHRQGTASGMVNIGGFIASLIVMFLIGVVLDQLHRAFGGELYDLGHFKIAMCVQFVFFAIGTIGILLSRRKARAEMARAGVHVPPILQAIKRTYGRR
ncbi:MFS transporter [Spelaeicoccus albus]|uniref:MFS family permease n=1 Tax=Spelaeicoccus albus TaxID=1280376 RepID=A0A7Z0D3F0_9MICO|nr:MFS transporter [Spelaeicoccus albus]NYI68147.1 MFS family permease [Spelaeicoccus albus]